MHKQTNAEIQAQTLATTESNRELMRGIFAELAKGNGRPFVDAMADNFCWVLPGQTAWSRRYEGKQAVREELFRPLFAQFDGQYTNQAINIIADGDKVAVECRGQVTTKKGKPYNNTYCYVCLLEGGKLMELVEYMDTQMMDATLDAPG